jgi:LysR family transcriptional regulator, nod-box dependent transcriptional activator
MLICVAQWEGKMRFERLDLNLLVVLDVLIEEKSVSAVARRLNLSQPAISGSLNRLREYFGDDLLVPSGRTMLLTPKAEELREPVRDALMLIRTRITTPTAFDPATAERRFVLTASDYAFNVLLGDVMAQAENLAPGISFELFPTTKTAAEMLERGEVDLYITISSYMMEGHPRRPLWHDEHCVIAWSEGRYGLAITPEEFLQAGHAVAYFGTDRYPAFTESYFGQQGVNRRIDMKLPSFSLLPQAVVGTDRIATMYRRHAEYFTKFMPLTILKPPLPLPDIVEEVQWHKVREGDGGLQWLIGMLVAQASQI